MGSRLKIEQKIVTKSIIMKMTMQNQVTQRKKKFNACGCALKYSNPFLYNPKLAFLRILWEIFRWHSSAARAINVCE